MTNLYEPDLKPETIVKRIKHGEYDHPDEQFKLVEYSFHPNTDVCRAANARLRVIRND